MRAIVNRGLRPRFATAVLQEVGNDGPAEVSGPLLGYWVDLSDETGPPYLQLSPVDRTDDTLSAGPD
jgi:hypothetical protein